MKKIFFPLLICALFAPMSQAGFFEKLFDFGEFVEVENPLTRESIQSVEDMLIINVSNLLPTYKLQDEEGNIGETHAKVNLKVCGYKNLERDSTDIEDFDVSNFTFETMKEAGVIDHCVDLQGTVKPGATESFLIEAKHREELQRAEGLMFFVQDSLQFMAKQYWACMQLSIVPTKLSDQTHISVEVIERGGHFGTFMCNVLFQ